MKPKAHEPAMTAVAEKLDKAAWSPFLQRLKAKRIRALEAMERERKERKKEIWAREIQRLDRQIARIEAEIKGGGEGC